MALGLPKKINGVSAMLGLCAFFGFMLSIPLVVLMIKEPGRVDPIMGWAIPATVVLYGSLAVWTHKRYEARKLESQGKKFQNNPPSDGRMSNTKRKAKARRSHSTL